MVVRNCRRPRLSGGKRTFGGKKYILFYFFLFLLSLPFSKAKVVCHKLIMISKCDDLNKRGWGARAGEGGEAGV